MEVWELDQARPLCQMGHGIPIFYRPELQNWWAHGRTLTTDMFPLADFKSQISHQHLKPEKFTLKFSFLACAVSIEI